MNIDTHCRNESKRTAFVYAYGLDPAEIGRFMVCIEDVLAVEIAGSVDSFLLFLFNGGRHNLAAGRYSSVSGGGYSDAENGNIAFAHYSSVSGGRKNIAGDPDLTNYTIGLYSSISGGYSNTASGDFSSVFGGSSNEANCEYCLAPPIGP